MPNFTQNIKFVQENFKNIDLIDLKFHSKSLLSENGGFIFENFISILQTPKLNYISFDAYDLFKLKQKIQ